MQRPAPPTSPSRPEPPVTERVDAEPPRIVPTPEDVRPRLGSIDVLRGLVMVVMVLDHVRDFFHYPDADPTDLDSTTPALFLTRWISHFCPPVFLLLAGVSAYLYGARGRSRRELSWFLLTRGLWLIVLEVTVVHWGLSFQLNPLRGPLQVIWVIGASMMVLAGLVWLPIRAVGAFGLILIFGHNLLDPIRPEMLPAVLRPYWSLLHEAWSRIVLVPEVWQYLVVYPLVPWVGVLAAGYALGPVMRLEPFRQRRILLGLGLGLTALFVALRLLNRYGDPEPWSLQESGLFTVFSFLNTSKYPPSLLYLLMTLGPALMLLAVLDRFDGPLAQPLRTIGRVPLFFYLLQWPLAHALAILMAWLTNQDPAWLLEGGPFGAPDDYGYELPFVYLMWVVALLLLYPPSVWFAGLKRRRRDAWLSYF